MHVIIPARDEEAALPAVLEALRALDRVHVIVVDNGSRDGTAAAARRYGATVVHEARVGYGSACLAAIGTLAGRPGNEVVAFLDADGSDDPALLPALVDVVCRGEADFVQGSRTLRSGEAGSLTWMQRLGNRVACGLIRRAWGVAYTDLAPLRALRLATLRALALDDRDFGWTVQMQIRVARRGLRVRELPSRYRRRRRGRSKISGTFGGSMRAGYVILRTIGREWWRQRRGGP